MLILNRAAVAQSLSHAQCVDVLGPTMQAVSRGDIDMPLRQFMAIPDTKGKMAVMPGYVGKRSPDDPPVFGVKIVSKFPRQPDSPHSSHVGAVMLFDAAEGLPVALLDGAELTAIRTAAASALATRALAREESSTLVLLGCGEEARHHIQAIRSVRPISQVIVWGRNPERAHAFAAQQTSTGALDIQVETDPQKAVQQADVLCTVTSSPEPILKGEWLQPGMHVNLVGAAVKASAEADTEVVKRSRFYVDYLPSALAQAGELLNTIEAGVVTKDHVLGEIGAVLEGDVEGRKSDDDITVYKSLGVSAQDLAAGLCAVSNAQKNGIGTDVDW